MSASLTPLSLNGMGVAADHGQSQARTIVIQLCQCYTFTEASYHKLQMYKKCLLPLLLFCQRYTFRCRDIYLANVNRNNLDVRPMNVDILMAAQRWCQDLHGCMTQWSSWDMMTALVRWTSVKEATERLLRTLPNELPKPEPDRTPMIAGTLFVSPLQPDDEVLDGIQSILSSKDRIAALMTMEDSAAASFMDLLDQAMDRMEKSCRLYTRVFHTLRRLCASTGTFPSSTILSSSDLVKVNELPVASGGFADVWSGRYQNKSVALKAFRVYEQADLQKIRKKFIKEAIVWKRLSHPHITPFLGVNTSLFPLCIVSEWMANGNITHFLRKTPGANRPKLLVDVVRGLEYLHRAGVIHGDLKGANILINDKRCACLADFGLTNVVYDPDTMNIMSASDNTNGTARWMAPELLDPERFGREHSHVSRESDIYALAMVMWEVFAGHIPFHEYPRDATVIYRVLKGERPHRPLEATTHGLSDGVWDLIQACWHERWQRRPRVTEVFHYLQASSPCDGSRAVGPNERPNNSQKLSMQRLLGAPRRRMHPHVLLVDDDQMNRHLVSKYLKSFGCTVDVGADGADTVNKMNPENCDLVFVNIIGPKHYDVSTRSLIRKLGSMAPVIAMITRSSLCEIKRHFPTGLKEILPKPFTKDDLFAIVKKHLLQTTDVDLYKPLSRIEDTLDSIMMPRGRQYLFAISGPGQSLRCQATIRQHERYAVE
ncbi:hypothetical protein AcV5_006602 [Taiwanofungus camphoratus]|nr:hypothetical protein AcV5_006602 [Antrodia cinnamomea]